MTRLALAALIFLTLVAAITGGVWWFAFNSALEQLAERGRSDLSLASDRLLGELQQYRELAVLTADRGEIRAALGGAAGLERPQTVLLRSADKTGTLEIRLVRPDGAVLVSSNRDILPAAENRVGNPAFARAMQGALGAHHARTSGVVGRTFIYSAPVFADGGGVIGAVEVDVNIWAVESAWLGDPHAVFFTDEVGVVFISNRTELLFRSRTTHPQAELVKFGYDARALSPFVNHGVRRLGAFSLWSIDGGPYLPARALHLTQDLPRINMTGELLLDIWPALRIAGLQAAVAAALSLVLGGVVVVLLQRRRILTARLAIEAAANAELERRVAERTAALSASNTALRREVSERLEAEAALKKAQAELVQAGKLSALGQMSAGISHELNQPLMAIQTFAENGGRFLQRGNTDKAGENLGRIAQMAGRMARIIKNLRAFARNEAEPMGKVDLAGVIEQAVELTEARLVRDGITLDWTPPQAPVFATGGEVRLVQVFTNLITNAADAMAGQDTPRLIRIGINTGRKLAVTVRDTGPGISEPDRIFDPFYSTKAIRGGEEGMGLGLSISYGLVQSFGGRIRGSNAGGKGAMFTVELEYWKEDQAA